ncbi:type IV toxin-antitoxin system AbiEi family antitoxin domain-containing protein [Actinopolymorpha rutila]|uniref:Transcriptional regulator, AbiEi antitoxin, Type IV TA system n=1 Tax=Actinopolymorpha rutila TaxID=446787 RepID=A0A852ZA43_9ACTN|nr:hypothetical protein [Actinopolymorpha rutila]NYH88628.1 hypothetical protein [Actinopolymorpha rutila]
MARRVAGRVPPELLHGPVRVIRPGDAGHVYRHPRAEFARLARQGALHQLTPGYYAVVPDHLVGQQWLPDLEAAALGIAVAGAGVDDVALMGVSAARLHGAIPRALNVGVVATARRRRAATLSDRKGEIIFVTRDPHGLDLERVQTELGSGWMTTVEQTILDLAARPTLGDVPDETDAAVRGLLPRADLDLLHDLAVTQRRTATLQRVLAGDHA